jgi:predicted acyl esterase
MGSHLDISLFLLNVSAVNEGFVAVMQDFRGRYASDGVFDAWWNASTDASDTISWLVIVVVVVVRCICC